MRVLERGIKERGPLKVSLLRKKNKGKNPLYTKAQTTTFLSVSIGVNPTTPNMICRHCGKHHGSGPCRLLTGTCFRCGQKGHKVKNCSYPKISGDHS